MFSIALKFGRRDIAVNSLRSLPETQIAIQDTAGCSLPASRIEEALHRVGDEDRAVFPRVKVWRSVKAKVCSVRQPPGERGGKPGPEAQQAPEFAKQPAGKKRPCQPLRQQQQKSDKRSCAPLRATCSTGEAGSRSCARHACPNGAAPSSGRSRPRSRRCRQRT